MSIACKICGEDTIHAFSRSTDDGRILEHSLYGPGYTRPYFQCPSCGLLFHTAFDEMDGEQYELMRSGGRSNPLGDGAQPAINRALRELNIAGRFISLHQFDPAKLKLLVFGCGAGVSMNMFLQNNIDTYGTDIILSISRGLPLSSDVYKEELLPDMLKRFVDIANLPRDHFDIITMTEVFEHFTDPVKEIAALLKALKPGGIIYGTTGMADRVQGSLKDWWYLKCYTHTLFLTRRGFATLCRKLGVLGMIYPGTPEFIGNTAMSAEQGIFVLQKP